ncbi:MAG: hypothetical protein K2Z81_04855, partial [Cyanobacteria bacterium]|nr:hypothetical protein [Cyanobacteriota bacterium]
AASDSATIEERSKSVETEVLELKERMVKDLESLKEKETVKCNEHKESLAQELKRTQDEVNESLERVRATLAEKLGEVNLELSGNVDAFLEVYIAELQQMEYQTTSDTRSQGSTLTARLQKKLDQNLWEWKATKKQLSGQVEKAYMDRANSIESHFATLVKSIQVCQQDNSKKLEAAVHGSKEAAAREVETALARAEGVGSQLERDINQFFGARLSAHTVELKDELDLMQKDTDTTRSAHADALKEKTKNYVANLTDAARTAGETLKVSCEDTSMKAEEMNKELLLRLENRIAAVKHARTELEDTKKTTIQEICSEIAQLKERFEKSLLDLTKEAEENIQSISAEVEDEIRRAHSRCAKKLEEQGAGVKIEIDKQVQELLGVIKEYEESALAEIASSAGL